MSLTRRNALALGSASFVVTLMPLHAFAAKDETMAVINSFTGGAAVTNGGIKFSAPGAKRVMILADGNPTPGVGLFNFGKLSDASGSTRIRLAGTQDVIAVAEMADGSYVQVANTVKVTIGGCGG